MEKAFGYDYGIKPKVMVVGDMEFPELLRGGFTALAYGRVPQFGVLVNAPLLIMIFKDEEIGRGCFTHFKGWSDASGDGDAVGIGFIEFESGEYGMCIYPEHQRLINRCIPEAHRSEVEPIIMVVGHLKIFPQQSKYYTWFKSAVKISPFVLASGTMEDDPMLDLAICKREVHFYRENDIPEHTMEAALLRSREANGEGELHRPIPPEMKPSAQEIHERRRSQLGRFFPVTLERLRFKHDFVQIHKQLVEKGYRDWQIIQAGCNIVLKYRVPELFTISNNVSNEHQGDEITMRVLDYLLANFEDISMTFPPLEEFSVTKLREQIQADAYELLQYVIAPDIPEIDSNELQNELAKRGLLDE